MTPCTHDRCQQGRAPCPTPQACHMPEPARHNPTDERRDATEVVGIFILWAVCILALVGALSLAAGVRLG